MIQQLQRLSIRSAFPSLALALTVVGVVPVAHAQRNEAHPAILESRSAGVERKIEVLGDRMALPQGVASGQSRIVLYRTSDDRAGATSIFVNNRYHDSLVPGAWSRLCFAAGPVELATRQMETATRPAKDRYDAISALTLMGGQTHYLRVDMSAAYPVLRPVSAAQARQEMAGTREQLHTVSRVAQTCLNAPAAPIAPTPVVVAVPQTYTLAADTLFAFDRSDYAGMTDAGTRAIDLLLARLGQDYSRIDRVHLIGHADPLGLPERNERLAIERAQTVREYILLTRQLQAPITAEGRGSLEPLVPHCGNTATAQAIACNLPNRRVTVEVTGLKR